MTISSPTLSRLSLEDASVHYAGMPVLSGVSIEVKSGEVVALMGPNGAGKSTVLKALFGLVPLQQGEVRLCGKRLMLVPHEMTRHGIAYVPQGRQVFKDLSVRENLELGGYHLDRVAVHKNIEKTLETFPMLREKLIVRAGQLSGGQQQMLAIARGLVSDPKILLLDEPSLGLSPKMVTEVFSLIKKIRDEHGVGILVVEHSIASVLKIADRAYVLARGEIMPYEGEKVIHTFSLRHLRR